MAAARGRSEPEVKCHEPYCGLVGHSSSPAVFFGGGRQYRLVDAYAGTLTERAIRAVLARGGLIAGTSAGATILGSYLVRGAPSEGNSILMYPGYERGFAYLSNVAIDQQSEWRTFADVRPRIRRRITSPELRLR
ncbi:MAG: Type 1 glutamine amidotransferase-like domain-containing protein [Stellaceae bacterium]